MANFKNDIERYLKGELTAAEMHRLEKTALSDPFLSDALEGGEIAGGEKFSLDLRDIESRLQEKQNSRKPWVTTLRIAASLGLLIAASYFLYTSFFRPSEVKTTFAKVDSITSAPLSTKAKTKDSLNSAAIEQPQQKLLSFDHSVRKEDKVEEQVMANEIPASAPVVSEMEITKLSESGTLDDSTPRDSAKVEEEIIDLTKDKKQIAATAPMNSDGKIFSSPQAMKSRVAGVQVISRDVDKAAAREGNIPGEDMITGRVSLASRSAAGVHVLVKGTDISTKTDAQGNYEISTKKNKSGQSLIFSSEGYQTTEVDAGEQSTINIQLSDNAGKSAEVVVGTGPSEYNKDDPSTIFAQPINGERNFNKYLEEHLYYPKEAIEKNIQGKVWVEFKVKKDSSLTDFRVLHGIGFGCEEELIRVIKAGPAWIPLQQSETFFESKVRVRFKFSIPK